MTQSAGRAIGRLLAFAGTGVFPAYGPSSSSADAAYLGARRRLALRADRWLPAGLRGAKLPKETAAEDWKGPAVGRAFEIPRTSPAVAEDDRPSTVLLGAT